MPIAVGIVAFLIFAPTWGYPFVYDDVPIVVRNPPVTGDMPWYAAWSSPYWPESYGGDPLYRPFTLMSLRIDHALWGTNSAGYRIHASLLHALTSVAVCLLAERVWRRGVAGFAAGMLFALHPVHAETLGMVVGQSELLAGLLVSVMLWRHLHHLQAGGGVNPRHHLVMAGLFFLAICSKEHSAFAAPVLLLMDLVHRSERTKESTRAAVRRLGASHYLGLVVALALYLLLRWLVFGWQTSLPTDMLDPKASPFVRASVAEHLWTPFAFAWIAIELWISPIRLCPVWSVGGYDLVGTWLQVDVLRGMAAVIVLIALTVHGYRRRWRASWCLGASLLFLILPTHAWPAANWLFAERWLYLPSTIFAVLTAGLAWRFPRWGAALLVTVSIGLGLWTLQYERCWSSDESIFRCAVQRQPGSYHGLIGLAAVLDREGRLLEAGNAVDQLIKVHPDAPKSWYYYAKHLAVAGAPPREILDAIEQCGTAGGWAFLPEDLLEIQRRAQAQLEQDAIGATK